MWNGAGLFHNPVHDKIEQSRCEDALGNLAGIGEHMRMSGARVGFEGIVLEESLGCVDASAQTAFSEGFTNSRVLQDVKGLHVVNSY